MAEFTISGRLVSGKGEGAFFTGADWARTAFRKLLDIDPWPGTMNLVLDDAASMAAWSALKETPGLLLKSPEPGWCDARCFPVLVADREKGAVILPDVPDYAPNQMEIISACNLRATLGLNDGDTVTVTMAG